VNLPYDLQMEVVIRPGTEDDLHAVLKLWQVAETEPTHTDDLASLQQLVASDPEALLVAQAGDDLVGSVIAGWDGWRGSIYRLAVAPAHRRRGLAGELVRAAVTRLGQAGAVRLQAIVVENDDRAMGFWSNSGWVRQAQRVRFVKG
jgi:ribosomal protein S18 acetylase RimI-like enzyme